VLRGLPCYALERRTVEMEILFAIAVLAGLGIVAVRFGADTRERSSMGWLQRPEHEPRRGH